MSSSSSSIKLITLTKTSRFQCWSVISLYECAVRCLSTYNADEKAAITLIYSKAWKDGLITEIFPADEHMSTIPCPKQPERPMSSFVDDKQRDSMDFIAKDVRLATPMLSDEVRQRVKMLMKKSAIEYTVHGIANAESYAIDLFWDLIARFHADTRFLPREFFDDMVFIVEQESHHFTAWKERLQEMGYQFGCFPFQTGLWQSAGDTAGEVSLPFRF
jgi:hypothetical protein